MTKIKINLFNLTGLNKYLSYFKLGAFHTSLVIDDFIEFYFGFMEWGEPGVCWTNKIGVLPEEMQHTAYFEKSYELGETELTREECINIAMIFRRSEEWKSDAISQLQFFHARIE